MINRGISFVDIAAVLGRNERSVRRWAKDFGKKRMGSIFTGHKDNENAAKLTKTQKEEIKRTLSHKPSDLGLPKEFWDVPQLRTYVYARFQTVYESDRSYHFLLEFGDLTFKSPDKFKVQRNEKLIANRMDEIYGEIIPLLENPNWEVFCADETGLLFQSVVRRAWLKRGEKTVIKVENKRDGQNYLGFLNQGNFKCHVLSITRGRTKEIIKATTEFLKLYPNKRICIIWDNATHHKGRLFREALSKGGPLERVHLIALPPYAPDCNPIEKVWNFAKNNLANKQDKNFEETKNKFMQLTNNQIFPYQI